MPTAEQLVAQGQRLYHEGAWQEALPLLQAALSLEPEHAPALHLLGSIALENGQPQQAVEFLQRATAVRPEDPELLTLLGAAWHALGRFDQAAACYRRALQSDPGQAMTLNNLGITLMAEGKVREATGFFQQAHQRQPDDTATLSNLAAALHARGDLEPAASLFRRAIALQPGLPQAHNNLGNVLQDLGHWQEAETCYGAALRLAPAFALAHGNLGDLLARRGRLAEAVAAYRRAWTLQPARTLWAARLVDALLPLRRIGEAQAACQEALQHGPESPELLNALGNTLAYRDRLDEAGAAYQRAVAARPDWSVPHYNLGLNLLNRGRLADAWQSLQQAIELAPGDPVPHSTYLGSLLYAPQTSGTLYLEEAARWVQRHVSPLPPPAPHSNNPDPERLLRVGYISPDFRSHAVAFFLEPILANHNRDRFEVFAYAEVSAPDEVTARLRGLVAHWRDTVGKGDSEVAALIRQDEIDVLVELGGHLAGNRLLACARRPAPVQISYLGYPASTGLAALPYRLADAVTATPGEPLAPQEELVLLPGPFCCYLPPPPLPLDPVLPSRRRGLVTFGSLHKPAKLNDAVLDLWARLLQAVPGSRLLLCRSTLHANDVAWFVEQFRRRGLAAGRVILSRPQMGSMRHLRAYGDIDVVLDTFPWSGHTTACEALWMGVPVVTLKGANYAGRMTASVLECLGLGAWAADTAEDYVGIAQQLAGDEGLRVQLQGRLRERLRASPLCDGRGFTRGLEEVYRQLWRRWCGAVG